MDNYSNTSTGSYSNITWFNPNSTTVSFTGTAVDYVIVTRCKNCKFCKKLVASWGEEYLECQLTEVKVREDDYCSYGEEK